MRPAFASVDLGGTKTACAIATAEGEILAEGQMPTGSHDGAHAVLERIAALLGKLRAQASVTISAIGFGAPGLVDCTNGQTRFLPNLPTQWRDIPVAALLQKTLGCPVFLLNDARMATLGEFRYGRGRTANTMAFLTIGTGIGGGLVIEGRLRLGSLGAAGELGHQTIVQDGPQCGCGNRGCLEVLASGPALVAEGVRLLLSGLAPVLFEIVNGNAGAVTPKEMGRAARSGDAAVRHAIERAGTYLGIGIANITTALDPDLVVLGGSVAALDDLLLEPVRAAVRDRVRMFPADRVAIERSALEDRAGLLGGIALAAGETRCAAWNTG